ncbi:MAG: hypothetical protein WAW17_02245 [Rhodococcus sp. (in: high G+C Gram-positive bacteria)]|uniref:hypothetical protein n=1 Tax=Rhodococcus sp. TaxID=1831 RepID=UPI003BB02880
MNFSRGTLTVAAAAGALCIALAPMASAATTYQISVIPPIGTVTANNLVTLGFLVSPIPTGEDGSTPLIVNITEPDKDTYTHTVSQTLGAASLATRLHEAGRYVAVVTFDPPNGDSVQVTTEFDVVPGASLGSLS